METSSTIFWTDFRVLLITFSALQNIYLKCRAYNKREVDGIFNQVQKQFTKYSEKYSVCLLHIEMHRSLLI